MASHEDHRVSLCHTLQCKLYVVPGILNAQPLPPQSSSSPRTISVGGMLHPRGRRGADSGKREERGPRSGAIAEASRCPPEPPNVVGAESAVTNSFSEATIPGLII